MLLEQIEKKVRAWVKQWILPHRFLWLIIGAIGWFLLCWLFFWFFDAESRFMSSAALVLLVFTLLWFSSNYAAREQTLIMEEKQWILAHRFPSLMKGAAVGIVLCFPVVLFGDEEKSRFISSFALLVLALPVFTLLWFFRTHDTKTQIEKSEKQIRKSEEQIEKSEKQINQSAYFKGLENLHSKDELKTVIGVRQLVELQKSAKEYKQSIKIALEIFLQSRKKSDQGKESDQAIDYRKIDFSDIYLHEAHLESANLQALKLNGADLSNAHLRGADLSHADLSHADLKEADLSGADLRGAKLRGVYLREANLSSLHMRQDDLVGIVMMTGEDGKKIPYSELAGGPESDKSENVATSSLHRAFYYQGMKPTRFNFKPLGYSLKDDTKDGKPIVRIYKEPLKTSQKTD